MLRIRTVKTASGARAVQVIYYLDRKRIIYKHIGSGKTDAEVQSLLLVAQDFIDNYSPELPFEEEKKFDNLLFLDKAKFLGVNYNFLYEVLSGVLVKIGFSSIRKQFLLDLVVMRIFEPCSKLRAIELLAIYFGINHRRQAYYSSAKRWLTLKEKVGEVVIGFARNAYGFDFQLLFYDVTTLYFETFESDELRKPGFSKDNKSQQPQILVGLMVTSEGFPVDYEIFSGNTFEGHTIIPFVKSLIKKHKIEKFTVVADAAMISHANIEEFRKEGLHYIVGARLGNLPHVLAHQIDSRLPRADGQSIRINTPKGYLVCSYSHSRYRKDKYEMEKQIERAQMLLKEPGKIKKVKFLKTANQHPSLNQELIERTKALLGVKGYYTDLGAQQADNQTIMARYHDLYKVEQAFRIAKSDLKTRPIFHYKEDPIKLHTLICFMALVVSKYIELSTGVSIKKFMTEMKKVTDARLLNEITNKEIRKRAQMTPAIQDLLQKLNLPH